MKVLLGLGVSVSLVFGVLFWVWKKGGGREGRKARWARMEFNPSHNGGASDREQEATTCPFYNLAFPTLPPFFPPSRLPFQTTKKDKSLQTHLLTPVNFWFVLSGVIHVS